MNSPNTLLRRALTLLFLLALFGPPFLFGEDKYWMPLFNKYVAIAIFALGVDLVWGYTGLLSLGQGLFFGLGAYAVGYSLKLHHAAQAAGAPPGTVVLPDFMEYCRLPEVPFWVAPLVNIWLALAVALVLPTLVAALFGFVTFRLRIRGVYFALITQALVLAMFTLVVNQQPYTGGVVGMTYLARLELFGHTFNTTGMYFLITSLLVVCYLGLAWLMRSKFGKVLTAIRDNEYRTLALGYNTAMYKTFAFALAGMLSGLSGALYVAANRTAGPEYFGIAFSIEVVILVAVGGRGTLIGAILGAILVRLANTYINDEYKGAWPIILGSLFVLVVVFLPEGIIGLFRKLGASLHRLPGFQERPVV
jgi:urea transport system permease protein